MRPHASDRFGILLLTASIAATTAGCAGYRTFARFDHVANFDASLDRVSAAALVRAGRAAPPASAAAAAISASLSAETDPSLEPEQVQRLRLEMILPARAGLIEPASVRLVDDEGRALGCSDAELPPTDAGSDLPTTTVLHFALPANYRVASILHATAYYTLRTPRDVSLHLASRFRR